MASTIFSGNSRFASDFTSIIDRSLAIASLPKTQLQNQQAELTNQKNAWATLQSKFANLRSSLTSFTNTAGSSGVTANSNDLSIAIPTKTDSVLQGTYRVEVVDIGVKTTVLGSSGVADPSTEALAPVSEFSLSANGVTTVIKPKATTLSSLVDAINQDTSTGVSATLVNVASQGSPANYRLSLQSTKYSAAPITLSYEDGGTQELLGASTPGAPVTYRLNGYPAPADPPLTSDTRTLPVSLGLTVAVGKAGTADITVNRSSSTLTSAISSLVAAYNSSVDELDKSHGKSGGALKGQSSITMLSYSLRKMFSYSGSGSISSAADLGIEFGSDGKLIFDSNVIGGMSTSKLASVTTFLGDGTTTGFLAKAADALNEADSSTFGLLPSEINQLTTQLADKQKAIDESQRRIDDLQTSLAARMSAADALIASLEQQVNYFTGMFEAMRANSSNN